MEVAHLPIGWVVLVKLLCEEWREGMLSTRDGSAVMREAVGCEMHAHHHVRGLGHRLVRAKSDHVRRNAEVPPHLVNMRRDQPQGAPRLLQGEQNLVARKAAVRSSARARSRNIRSPCPETGVCKPRERATTSAESTVWHFGARSLPDWVS